MSTIVLTGGGTAGHVTANINLLPHLQKHFNHIEYIGSKTGIEKELICAQNIPYHTITTTKFVRKSILKNLKIPFELAKGTKEAKKLLKQIKPSVVFSKGGFVSVPVVLAAKKLGIPVIAHESDLSPGLANRLVSKKCKTIFTSFEQTAQKLKNGRYSGPPLAAPLDISKEDAKISLGITTSRPVLLITGGSSGAKALNSAMEAALPEITKEYFVIHLTGKGNKTNFSSLSYIQAEYHNNMPLLMRAADFSITRGGSNTIFELAANNVPMAIVPLPKGTSRGDQIENAAYFKSKGYSITLFQESLNKKSIIFALKELKNNEKQIKQAQKQINPTAACKTIATTLAKASSQKK